MRRKLLCLIVAIMCFLGASAQVAISEFVNSHGESFKVTLVLKKDKPYKVSIECETSSKSKGDIWINPKDVAKFREALISLKDKFEEWDSVAKANDVTEADKDMPIKFPKVQFVWGYSTTFFADGAFKSKWVLKSPVEMVLCMAMVKASNNQFAEETFILKFFNTDDVQNFIDALDQNKIDASIRITEKSDLFN